MPALDKRNSVIVLGLAIIVVIAIGASRGPKEEELDELEVPFTESELDELGESIEGLEFEDLVGLSGIGTIDIGFSEEDLDNLGKALEGLEFDDLGGLTES